MPDGNHIARPKTLLVADLFCGAVGSSTGAVPVNTACALVRALVEG